MKLAGIVLIVLGILALIYQFIPVTETKQDAKLGPISIQHQETHYYPVTIVGVVLLGGRGGMPGRRRPALRDDDSADLQPPRHGRHPDGWCHPL